MLTTAVLVLALESAVLQVKKQHLIPGLTMLSLAAGIIYLDCMFCWSQRSLFMLGQLCVCLCCCGQISLIQRSCCQCRSHRLARCLHSCEHNADSFPELRPRPGVCAGICGYYQLGRPVAVILHKHADMFHSTAHVFLEGEAEVQLSKWNAVPALIRVSLGWR